MLKVLYQKVGRFVPMDFTRVLLWHIDATGYIDETPHTDHSRLCSLDQHQLMACTDNPRYELNPIIAQSVSSGQVTCFGAYVDDVLAAYVFFCNSPVEAQRNSGGSKFTGIQLTFPSNVSYLYKMFVLPEYRGRQLAGKLIQFAGAHFNKLAVSYIVTTTDWTNTSFLKSTASVGFTSIGMAGEYVLFGSHRYVLPAAIALSGNAEPIELTKP